MVEIDPDQLAYHDPRSSRRVVSWKTDGAPWRCAPPPPKALYPKEHVVMVLAVKGVPDSFVFLGRREGSWIQSVSGFGVALVPVDDTGRPARRHLDRAQFLSAWQRDPIGDVLVASDDVYVVFTMYNGPVPVEQVGEVRLDRDGRGKELDAWLHRHGLRLVDLGGGRYRPGLIVDASHDPLEGWQAPRGMHGGTQREADIFLSPATGGELLGDVADAEEIEAPPDIELPSEETKERPGLVQRALNAFGMGG